MSSQLLVHDHQYGFDPILEYIDIYFPKVGKGMNLRAGRFISIPGIEAQLTPNNYMFSHSLLYAIDPFTDTGILATVELSEQWLVQAGITGSHDVALWTSDAKPSATACVSHTSRSVNDNVYVCANGINDGKYAYNNVQQYDGTWYHKFSKDWHMATEAYVMYQRDVPSTSGSLKPQPNTNGATCRPGLETCLAPEYAAVNYVLRQLSSHDFIGFRSDLLNDKKGQRTGRNHQVHRKHLDVEPLDRLDGTNTPGNPLRSRLGPQILRPGKETEPIHRRLRSHLPLLTRAGNSQGPKQNAMGAPRTSVLGPNSPSPASYL